MLHIHTAVFFIDDVSYIHCQTELLTFESYLKVDKLTQDCLSFMPSRCGHINTRKKQYEI